MKIDLGNYRNWTVEDALVGHRVSCLSGYGKEFAGTVVAVHKTKSLILVEDRESEETGEFLVGNRWEELDVIER